MKLETKRFLAKEWLILLGLTVILFLGRDGWLWWNARISDRMVKFEADACTRKDISNSEWRMHRDYGVYFTIEKNNFNAERSWKNKFEWIAPWVGGGYLGLWAVRATVGAAGVLLGRRKPNERENKP